MLRSKIKVADYKGKKADKLKVKKIATEEHMAHIFAQYPHVEVIYVNEETEEWHVNKPFDAKTDKFPGGVEYAEYERASVNDQDELI